MPSQKSEIKHWQARRASRAAADTRLAEMLADMVEQARAANKAYGDRLEAMFSRADYDRLFDAWEAGQDAPADLVAQLDADTELRRLGNERDRLLWYLIAVRRGGIVSEHYVYRQTGGKMTGPNGER